MKLLALDIGTVRTGVALADSRVGIPMPLTTLVHQTPDELVWQVNKLCDDRDIDRLIIGLPLLLDGTEGKQSALVRQLAQKIAESTGLPVVFQDERYSSKGAVRHGAVKRKGKRRAASPAPEEDAIAALHLLSAHLGIDG